MKPRAPGKKEGTHERMGGMVLQIDRVAEDQKSIHGITALLVRTLRGACKDRAPQESNHADKHTRSKRYVELGQLRGTMPGLPQQRTSRYAEKRKAIFI